LSGDRAPAAFELAEPAYGRTESLPIDLPTALALVDANSPTVAVARARIREALARQDQAQVLWLPSLTGGVIYNRFDGQTQNQRGEVFGTSRSNLFGGGGPQLTVDVADAYYQPLIACRETAAANRSARATAVGVQLDAALAYLDLLQTHALLSINEDMVARVEGLVQFSKDATDTGASKSATDINRALTELALRKSEHADLVGRAGASAARLGRLLQLDPGTKLFPADPAVLPVVLVDASQTLDELVMTAISNRDDLAANRQIVAAAWDRVRKSRATPLLPKVVLGDQVGGFGGGINEDVSNFSARNALNVQLYWELKNLGFGNAARTREYEALTQEAAFRLAELQVRIIAEIAEAARTAAAEQASFEPTRTAIIESLRWHEKSMEIARNAIGRRGEFDSLEPLRSVQSLNTSRITYLSAVMDFNRAQYRLFSLLGNPACRAADTLGLSE
jgi:outer membrane protein TolC